MISPKIRERLPQRYQLVRIQGQHLFNQRNDKEIWDSDIQHFCQSVNIAFWSRIFIQLNRENQFQIICLFFSLTWWTFLRFDNGCAWSTFCSMTRCWNTCSFEAFSGMPLWRASICGELTFFITTCNWWIIKVVWKLASCSSLTIALFGLVFWSTLFATLSNSLASVSFTMRVMSLIRKLESTTLALQTET